MTTKSLLHSSLLDNQYYTSMLAGNDAYAPSAMDLLETVAVTSNTTGISFTGLNAAYSADYQDLEVWWSARDTRGDHSSQIRIQLNGNTSNVYFIHGFLGGSHLNTNFYSGSATSSVLIDAVTGANATANVYGNARITFTDAFRLNRKRTVRGTCSMTQDAGYSPIAFFGGYYNSTAVIDTISLTSHFGSLVPGSFFSLYGRKVA